MPHSLYAAMPATTQVTPLLPCGTLQNGRLGRAMAVSGDTLVVGAPEGYGRNQLTGAACVYVRTLDGWKAQAVLTASDGFYSDKFGAAVAIDGDTLIVGAPQQGMIQEPGNTGAAYIFTRNGNIWIEQAKLAARDVVFSSTFGQSVAVQGDTVVVGSNADPLSTSIIGATYIFERTGIDWVQTAKLFASDHAAADRFSSAVALSGDELVVGAPGKQAAYIFARSGSGWSERQKISSPGATIPQNLFGAALAFDGVTLAIGAPHHNGYLLHSSVFIYTSDYDQWSRKATLQTDDGDEPYSYGTALALSGDTLLVGTPRQSIAGNYEAGSAYLYRANSGKWPLTAILSPPHLLNEQFGTAVAIHNGMLFVGAPEVVGAGGSAEGIVYTSYVDSLSHAAADRVTTPEDTPISIAATANDATGVNGSLDPSYLTVALVQLPQHGDVEVIPATNTFVYTPTADFYGIDSFRYTAGWGLPATVFITVMPVADAPTFTSLPSTSALEGVPYNYAITTADVDAGEQRTIHAVGVPGWMHFMDYGDGTAELTGTAVMTDVGSYAIHLIVTDAAGLQATQAFTVTVDAYVPVAPDQLTATVLSSARIQLRWRDQSNNELGFRIERREGDNTWQTIATLSHNTTTFDDRGRTCNVPYSYRVVAFNQRGESPATSPVEVSIPDCTLRAPINLRATVVATDVVQLSWVTVSENATEVQVEQQIEGEESWHMVDRTADQRFYTHHALTCGPVYRYRVRSANPGALSDPSESVQIHVCPPNAPTQLRIVATSKLTATLQWDDTSDNESSFAIDAIDMHGDAYQVGVARANITTSTLYHAGCGAQLRYRVRAVNGAGTAVSDTVVATATPCDVRIMYVDVKAVNGAQNGQSWTNAFRDVQSALVAAAADVPLFDRVEIWVAEGMYKPTQGVDRTASFQLVNAVVLYGGFAGTETTHEQRNWQLHPTILSGDIGIFGEWTDNSYHVVTSAGADNTTILNGFIVADGYTRNDNGPALSVGGGMYNQGSSPTVQHVIFLHNYAGWGGGMANVDGSSPTVRDVSFLGNAATRGGGMLNQNSSSPTLTNVIFSGNSAENGGGMFSTWFSNPVLINATLSQNDANSIGGALYTSARSQPVIRNSIFWGNTALFTGAVAQMAWENDNSIPQVSDSILQNSINPSGTITGVRNRITDPIFINPNGPDERAGTVDDDLHLLAISPAIDAGNNTDVPTTVLFDYDGAARFVDDPQTIDTGVGQAPLVDIGAYEFQDTNQSSPAILTVNFQRGKPGSSFLIAGTGYASHTRLTLHVGHTPIGVVSTGTRGAFKVLLITDEQAQSGVYQVVVSAENSITVQTESTRISYVLDPTAPLYITERAPDMQAFMVPVAPANVPHVYLPLISE